ncbi:MAG: hypothetical protein HC919_13805 [Oscillatoriales cyanobacterium SM2_2_1]|nr:hypothetical protein [Oscillatoriales cyanobacterium SM2_2_1]
MLGDRLVYAVVGVGINWRNPVPVGAIALTEVITNVLGLHELRAVVLEGLDQGYGRFLGELNGGTGLVSDYQSLLVSRRVAVIHGAGSVNHEDQGVIETILPTGMAIVRWDGGRVSPHLPSSLRSLHDCPGN